MTNKEFLSLIQKETNKNDFDRYLKQLVLKKLSIEENIAIFEVANKYIASWIKSKYTNLIQNCFEKNINIKPDIEIRLIGEKKTKKRDTKYSNSKSYSRKYDTKSFIYF